MKILHTSDWHVGKTLRGRSRAAEHEAVLQEISTIASDEQVDLVLVTGDLFDTAAPTAEAERIVYRAILDLRATGATVIVLSGNHDNERRLQAIEPILGLGQIVTRASVVRADQGGVIDVLTGRGERAKVAVLPFLSQRYVVRADQLMSGDAADHDQAYAERMHRLIASLCAAFEAGTVNIVAAHLFADGGTMGGGERKAQTIMDYAIPAAAFPPSAHYVALGHLHRAQKIAGACPIWYAGSPLQLDFGEVRDDKVVLIVEAEVGRPAHVRQLLLQSGRRLRTVAGTLAELAGVDVGDDYVRVVVREPARAGLADEVRALFPDAVDVVVEAPAHEGPGQQRGADDAGPRIGRSPHDLFADYLAERGVEDARVEALFGQLLDEAHAS